VNNVTFHSNVQRFVWRDSAILTSDRIQQPRLEQQEALLFEMIGLTYK